MIVSVNQPAYLAWLGYYQRIAEADLHVVLDHVQFEKNSYTNRNRVRTAQGWTWLTVPVLTKGRFGDLTIDRLEVDCRQDWGRKHWATLSQAYRKAPFFAEHAPFLETLYARPWPLLAGLVAELDAYLLAAFGIGSRIVASSGLDCRLAKDELVLEICRKVGATTYVSGALGREYLRESLFAEAGIRVVYQDYRHPVYRQCHAGAFEPYMAALDLLLNHGPEASAILRDGQTWSRGLRP
ncbi:MAG: WbqC family protein [Magnetospirillum sp. WYHS-4]